MLKHINTYRVIIEKDYIIGVHALNKESVIEWLDYQPKSIELIEVGDEMAKDFEPCLALYNSID